MYTGSNIKKLRLEKGVSKTELQDVVQINAIEFDSLEEQGNDASISQLMKIANYLGTDITTLLYGKEFKEQPVVVSKPVNRVKIKRKKSFDFENLAPHYYGRHIEPFIIDVHPTSEANQEEYHQHPGEEFHYVLEGQLKVNIANQEHILDKGDSIYFDSVQKHSLSSVGESAKIIVMVYNSESMTQLTKSHQMRNLIDKARIIKNSNIVVVIPNVTAIEAVNKAIGEKIINKAYLVGDRRTYDPELLRYSDHYIFTDLDASLPEYEELAAEKAVELIRSGQGNMIMKGKINTAVFLKSVLSRSKGIGTGRRLSMISLFELPKLHRLVVLTDPGINPTLTTGDNIDVAKDIIHNAIDVAQSVGIERPKVAILDANELPSAKIPSSVSAKKLSEMKWENAEVFGPLSYDLALYPESVASKGLSDNPVAGKADILIVPHISGGNFLYKAWVMTMSAEAANVVLGAKVPILLSSRSDSDMTKFLTICASVIYADHSLNKV